ncbi:3-hydroxyacyl-CoA dehydrogenase [Microbacterium sp. CPCC 204701]|uniref:3-hydroxyacyl-CoA dehydrogenase n=1 Tax=Microbacterium sp. CPCC 204701 TaxID=2493084 RepID=UPI000FDA44E6|nr:3-hydroxyacyl-CoA dehydrogenase [Microbacterium sp. CPCC 204701]
MSARPTWLTADVLRRPDPAVGGAHAHAAQRAAAEFEGLPVIGEDWRPRAVGIVGAGTMGGGIAMAFANVGVPVVLVDRSSADVHRGMERIRANYNHSVTRGRLEQTVADERLALISASDQFAALAPAEVVIEAVFEDLDLKRRVFVDIDRVAASDALLCTNTSGLDIDRIAEVTGRPEVVIGTHFFSPANVMRLLEVVSGARTSPETLAKVLRIGDLIGKIPVPAGNAPSFIGNAMLADYSRETNFLVEEGSSPSEVDGVLEEFGFAMGLFKVGDMAGLDVGLDARRQAILTRPKDRRHSDLRFVPIEMGRLGQKTGAGWYRYEPGSRMPLPDPELDAALIDHSARIGIERRQIGAEEIVARCLYALVNRGAWLLQDGVASKPGDIDAVYVTGYGFPADVGGPMFWADEVGLAAIAADIGRLHQDFGGWWEPAPLLLDLARTGRRFADLDPRNEGSR